MWIGAVAEDIALCDICGNSVEGEPFELLSGKKLCRACFLYWTFCCPGCGEDFEYSDGIEVHNTTYCKECASDT